MAALPRVLVVGGGSIGERHARCLLRTGRCTVALCDVSPERRAELAARYPLSATYDSLEATLDGEWEAAVLATPAPLHVPQARALAARGAALLIEKPLSTTLAGVAELRGEVARWGVPAGVAYVMRAHPAVTTLRELLREETLGPLRHVTAVSGQHFPTFRPAYRDIYYARRSSGGGAVQDALTHLVDLVAHLAGPFQRVTADWDRQSLEGVAVEDTVNVLARLREGGVMASLALNQFQAPNETTVSLHGERGSARLELHRARWGTLRQGETEWQWSPPLVAERDDLFVRQAEAFLDAVEGRAAPLCSLEEAEHVLRVNLAILRSGASGLPVDPGAADESWGPEAGEERLAPCRGG